MIYGFAFRIHFIAVFIQQNNISVYSFRANDLSSLRFLANLTVSGVNFISWSLILKKEWDYSSHTFMPLFLRMYCRHVICVAFRIYSHFVMVYIGDSTTTTLGMYIIVSSTVKWMFNWWSFWLGTHINGIFMIRPCHKIMRITNSIINSL